MQSRSYGELGTHERAPSQLAHNYHYVNLHEGWVPP